MRAELLTSQAGGAMVILLSVAETGTKINDKYAFPNVANWKFQLYSGFELRCLDTKCTVI